jgi:hypothetical protein
MTPEEPDRAIEVAVWRITNRLGWVERRLSAWSTRSPDIDRCRRFLRTSSSGGTRSGGGSYESDAEADRARRSHDDGQAVPAG